MAAPFDLRGEREETFARARQVMQHADRESVIENRLERQLINIRLHDMRVRERACRRKRRLDRRAQINTDDIACAPAGGQLCMTALAAAAFENYFAAKKFRAHGRDPA